MTVLATLLVASLLITIVKSGTPPPYDPWQDINDDGIIDVKDILTEALAYGAQGEPINKTALLLGLQSRVDALEPHGAVYRWNVFDTYDTGGGFTCGNDPSLFGGVAPSQWSTGFALASQMSSDKEVLRTLFSQKGYGGKNALVYSGDFQQYGGTNGRVIVCLFRIKNTMGSPITWTPVFRYTAYNIWGEMASVALNGANMWSSNGGTGTFLGSVSLPIPANRTSTVIFVSTSSQGYVGTDTIYSRLAVLAFTNNCLELPAGLQYVDDLDRATGGWEQ